MIFGFHTFLEVGDKYSMALSEVSLLVISGNISATSSQSATSLLFISVLQDEVKMVQVLEMDVLRG